jgi:hypothetical protein
MSHFGVLVLADETLDRASAKVYCQRVLAPYSETLEVEEHEVQCWCVGHQAKIDARDEISPHFAEEREQRRAEFQELRKEVLELSKGEIEYLPIEGSAVAVLPDSGQKQILAERERVMNEEWKTFIARWQGAEKDFEKAHPLYGKPDLSCEECDGTGRYQTRVNERGYWDWFVIGGRWTGALDPEYDPSADDRNFAKCNLCEGTGKRPDMEVPKGCNGCEGTGISRNWGNAPIDTDVRPLSEIPHSVKFGQLFYAIVTPDGEWHQQGRMGWWGMRHDDMDGDTWNKYADSLVANAGAVTAIVVDAHI